MIRRILTILAALLLLTGCTVSTPERSAAADRIAETAPAPETQPADPLELLLANMSREQKVGQLFIIAPEQLLAETAPVREMSPELREALTRCPVGGVILFGDNILSPEQLETFLAELQRASEIPLFLAVDEEGGAVARLAGNDAFSLPTYRSAAAVAASGDPEAAREMGRTIGAYLKQCGFNTDFAPVADVNTNPANPVIGSRAFSSDPETAAQMAASFAEGLSEQGVIATYKHFPGHGDTAADSHTGLAVSTRTRPELEACELLPFRSARDTDLVMVGHIALPYVTGYKTPATLSRTVVTGILKQELRFNGLVITDAMNMGAITESYASGKAAVAALKAGCHLILMPENLMDAFQGVIAALEDGTLTEQWLDETVRKILEFKLAHGILHF